MWKSSLRILGSLLLPVAVLGGCGWRPSWPDAPARGAGAPAAEEAVRPAVDPLPVQQARAYAETVTGVFASLADFEDSPSGLPAAGPPADGERAGKQAGQRGFSQVRYFAVRPAGPDAWRKFVVNVTRTGAGAMEVSLPPGGRLVFSIPHFRDFTGYKLLSMALNSRMLRDDLEVALVTDGATWRSPGVLVEPGWNNVLIDIRRLAGVSGFDLTSVRSVEIGFPASAGAVWFNLDDVMLVDNERQIGPTPPGMVLRKSGLDYTLTLPGHPQPLHLAQGADGLWRLEGLQPVLRLSGDASAAGAGEDVSVMGSRRVGRVEVLEHNAVRLRVANTWYFPSRAGQWASLAVRQVRWEHTFYGDGRCVTELTVNNAGGRHIAAAGISLPWEASWAGGQRSAKLHVGDFAGPVGRWRFLLPPPGRTGETMADNYLRPGRVVRRIAAADVFAPGDADRDGYDESQGCFFLKARNGHCRFTYVPPERGAWDPVFLVAERWLPGVHVSSAGRALRHVVRRDDGSVLVMLPGLVREESLVEMTGGVSYRPGE